MKTFNIGYFNKPWNNSDFVILAQTHSENVAEFIKTSYNEGYERAGMSCRLVIVTDGNLPIDHRYSV